MILCLVSGEVLAGGAEEILMAGNRVGALYTTTRALRSLTFT